MTALASLAVRPARLHRFRSEAPAEAGHVVCMAGAGAGHGQFTELAQACAGRWHVHAFQAFDFTPDESGASPRLADVAEAFVQALRELPPPYRLVGHSAGAFVAYEVAALLDLQAWSQLLIVDAYLPRPDKPLLDAEAGAHGALQAFVAAMVQQLPALAPALADLQDLGWDDAPERLSIALRRHGLFLPAREIAARLLHFRHYTGFRFQPEARLPGARTTLVLASDMTFAECGLPRRDAQWHPGFDQPPRVHTVQGDHFSMLRRPHVDTLAALLDPQPARPDPIVPHRSFP
ncbi:alpha/beta fold hydrolase [Roseateles flavus]|uniref:Alpha/beta fold hydrolase n=1 Tax=Roseateles flavus TaxID=3149041 RepID=A0ABV0GJ37_9BURK